MYKCQYQRQFTSVLGYINGRAGTFTCQTFWAVTVICAVLSRPRLFFSLAQLTCVPVGRPDRSTGIYIFKAAYAALAKISPKRDLGFQAR